MSLFAAPHIQDPILANNYALIWRHFQGLIDEGIMVLREMYIENNNSTPLSRFSAISFYDYILKQNIEVKLKNQLRVILKAGIECVNHYDHNKKEVNPEYLDKTIGRRYPLYRLNDMTLLHSSKIHPAYPDIELISILTFRVAVEQTTRMLSCQQEKNSFSELARVVFPTITDSRNAIGAVLLMVDQMINCFDQNLDIINIPLFRSAFSIRNFSYIRKMLEFTLFVIERELTKIYGTLENKESGK
jgi:hypothetical protein